ncbi:hypothetical protein D3C72_2262190 [compost metagenome]
MSSTEGTGLVITGTYHFERDGNILTTSGWMSQMTIRVQVSADDCVGNFDHTYTIPVGMRISADIPFSVYLPYTAASVGQTWNRYLNVTITPSVAGGNSWGRVTVLEAR